MASSGQTAETQRDALLRLDRIFIGLAKEDSRVQAAIDLRNFVSSTVSELPSDANVKLWDGNINDRLAKLVQSVSVSDRLGAVVAISTCI